jgi:hypothetical protein
MGTSPMSSFSPNLPHEGYNINLEPPVITSNEIKQSNANVTGDNAIKLNGFVQKKQNGDYDDNSDISISSSCHPNSEIYNSQSDFLIAVHRKFTRQETYFLSHQKSKPSLFGVPLLIPIYDDVKNKDLYCSAWLQVSRLLSPLPPSSSKEQSNHAEDCDDSMVKKKNRFLL